MKISAFLRLSWLLVTVTLLTLVGFIMMMVFVFIPRAGLLYQMRANTKNKDKRIGIYVCRLVTSVFHLLLLIASLGAIGYYQM